MTCLEVVDRLDKLGICKAIEGSFLPETFNPIAVPGKASRTVILEAQLFGQPPHLQFFRATRQGHNLSRIHTAAELAACRHHADHQARSCTVGAGRTVQSSYKLLFAHRRMVADLIRGFVHEDWVAGLDFDTLERVSEISVTQDLRERVLLPAVDCAADRAR